MAYIVQAPNCEVSPGDHVQVHSLSAATVAYAVYQGSYDDFGAVGKVHAFIHEWAAANNYRLVGASCEFYLRPPQKEDDPQSVMEIQYPMEKPGAA